jgi:hypothetical protein
MAGGFDDPKGYDCIAEHFTVKTAHGAFAVIMNARYGWGTPGSTNGPSQRYHRLFWDAVFGESTPEIGKANQDSKDDIAHLINRACMRWIYYQLNLFGDPTLTFYENDNIPPDTPQRPKGFPIGKEKTNYTFETSSTDPEDDQISYKWNWGDGTFSEWLGPFDSGETLFTEHSWNSSGIYLVRVKARDIHRGESDWSDPLPIFLPSSKPVINPLFTRLLEFLKTHFPRLIDLLEMLR